jgi:heme exporter protein D
MPVRVRWFKGKHLGVAFIFFGVMGLFQSVFIAHGQYIADVGSTYVVTLIPIVVTLCLGYSASIIYEAKLQRSRQDQFKKGYKKQTKKGPRSELLLPLLLPLMLFTAIYAIAFYIAIIESTALSSFLIAENSAGIGVLVISSLLENRIAPNLKHF